jgi:hypothetical protein
MRKPSLPKDVHASTAAPAAAAASPAASSAPLVPVTPAAAAAAAAADVSVGPKSDHPPASSVGVSAGDLDKKPSVPVIDKHEEKPSPPLDAKPSSPIDPPKNSHPQQTLAGGGDLKSRPGLSDDAKPSNPEVSQAVADQTGHRDIPSEDKLSGPAAPPSKPQDLLRNTKSSSANESSPTKASNEWTRLESRILSIAVKDLPNVEKMWGDKNDLFASLSYGDVWRATTSVENNAGSQAKWDVSGNNDMTFVVDRSTVDQTMLSVSLSDKNTQSKDVLIGQASSVLSGPISSCLGLGPDWSPVCGLELKLVGGDGKEVGSLRIEMSYRVLESMRKPSLPKDVHASTAAPAAAAASPAASSAPLVPVTPAPAAAASSAPLVPVPTAAPAAAPAPAPAAPAAAPAAAVSAGPKSDHPPASSVGVPGTSVPVIDKDSGKQLPTPPENAPQSSSPHVPKVDLTRALSREQSSKSLSKISNPTPSDSKPSNILRNVPSLLAWKKKAKAKLVNQSKDPSKPIEFSDKGSSKFFVEAESPREKSEKLLSLPKLSSPLSIGVGDVLHQAKESSDHLTPLRNDNEDSDDETTVDDKEWPHSGGDERIPSTSIRNQRTLGSGGVPKMEGKSSEAVLGQGHVTAIVRALNEINQQERARTDRQIDDLSRSVHHLRSPLPTLISFTSQAIRETDGKFRETNETK